MFFGDFVFVFCGRNFLFVWGGRDVVLFCFVFVLSVFFYWVLVVWFFLEILWGYCGDGMI